MAMKTRRRRRRRRRRTKKSGERREPIRLSDLGFVSSVTLRTRRETSANPKQQSRPRALPGARRRSRPTAAVLPTDVTAQVMFCFVFLFYFFPLCSVMVAAIILPFFFFQIFSFTFYYVFL